MLTEQSQLDRKLINNDYYHELGKKWYTAEDDPVALLRAESKTRNPWIIAILNAHFKKPKILDVGCGGGFLSNALGSVGFDVTGIDISKESLEAAKSFDSSKSVSYIYGDAYKLPFPDSSFEAVTCMDFLEHVDKPEQVLKEISRVLKPNGLFFFHTFNRNPLAWLIVIKGVEWFVKNTPENLHVINMFIKPSELKSWLKELNFEVKEMQGLRPVLNKSFFKMLKTGIVDKDFSFKWTGSTLMSYTGCARKK
jgi:2-polyprenyl-6-hydroxyphenyl methylase/3-demethylubiquinone-9 3-methyltransferase